MAKCCPGIFVSAAANQGLDALRELLTQRVLQAQTELLGNFRIFPICSVEPDKGESLF